MKIPKHIAEHLKACATDNGWRADEIWAWIESLPEDTAAYRDRVRLEAIEEAARICDGAEVSWTGRHPTAAVLAERIRALAARSPATPGESR